VTLVASKVTADRATEPLAQPLDSIPFTLGEFSGGSNPPLTENVLKELKSSNYISRSYHKPGFDADLFIAYYAQQRAGESMHSPKHCLPGAGWEIWDYDSMPVEAGGREFTVNKYSISRAGERKQVLYWYESRDRVFASEYLGKLLLARDALLHNSTAASLVRIIVADEPGAAKTAASFASALIPEIQRCFGQ
jgi:EpsI family protein